MMAICMMWGWAWHLRCLVDSPVVAKGRRKTLTFFQEWRFPSFIVLC
jgi:hypothetical protein